MRDINYEQLNHLDNYIRNCLDRKFGTSYLVFPTSYLDSIVYFQLLYQHLQILGIGRFDGLNIS